jgi:hypothetical protein
MPTQSAKPIISLNIQGQLNFMVEDYSDVFQHRPANPPLIFQPESMISKILKECLAGDGGENAGTQHRQYSGAGDNTCLAARSRFSGAAGLKLPATTHRRQNASAIPTLVTACLTTRSLKNTDNRPQLVLSAYA